MKAWSPGAFDHAVEFHASIRLHVNGQHGGTFSPPQTDRIWGIWGSDYNILTAIFYLLKGDYRRTKFYEAVSSSQVLGWEVPDVQTS